MNKQVLLMLNQELRLFSLGIDSSALQRFQTGHGSLDIF